MKSEQPRLPTPPLSTRERLHADKMTAVIYVPGRTALRMVRERDGVEGVKKLLGVQGNGRTRKVKEMLGERIVLRLDE